MILISKTPFVIIALIIASIFINGCSTESPVRPDPCAGKTPVNADFEIYEQLPYDSMFVADTVLEGNVIHFIAKNGNYDSYRWKIGHDDSVFTANQVALRFSEPYDQIYITLIVHSKPDSSCLPDDDGVDTVYKKITVVKWMGGSALIGDYIGCNLDTPSDSFTVSIGFHESYLYGQYNYFYYVNNLNKGCKDPTMDDSSGTSSRHEIGYRNIRIENGTNGECRIPIGYANLDISHSQITIRYFLDGDSTKYYEYVGKKIK